MVRAEVLQGVRQMRFEGLLERHERGELSQEEAAEMLGVSAGAVRGGGRRARGEGAGGGGLGRGGGGWGEGGRGGLRDRQIGKPSSRRAAAEEILRMLGLYPGALC